MTAPNAPTANVSPTPNAAGWNNSTPVTVSFTSNGDAGSVQSGVVTCTGSSSLTSETAGTVVSGTCTDAAGNVSAPASVTVKIDTTVPTIAGLPAAGVCTLWPPNHKLVQVATVTASGGGSGLASLTISGSSNEPENGLGDGDTAPDIVITGGNVQLRAERSGTGTGRVYTLTAAASDIAGNQTTATATCVVPHDQRKK
ncbi:MAG: hypothetical protein A3H45_05670 [Ignavibacteria bacterium RIFCSPLOWO2_02_FULL_55_14]|nr:MAG: hypothetical protein A3H45_05670 [Ignavibacteria bacterium RIFCSPLOWO2_02_FULL_55_14]